MKFLRYCSGVKRHAWYETAWGIVRKPIQKFSVQKTIEKRISWWQKFINWIKNLFNK